MIKQRFTCDTCHRDVALDYQDNGQCCGAPMSRGIYEFPNGNQAVRRLHMLTLINPPIVEWQLPDEPAHIFEIWQLAPGRENGELLGWIGARATAVEWVMPKGIKIRGGFANLVEDAVASMLEALEGGVFASQHIHSEIA